MLYPQEIHLVHQTIFPCKKVGSGDETTIHCLNSLYSFSPSLKTQTFFLAFPPLVGFAEPAFLEGCFPFCCVFPFCCCLGGCRRKIKYSSYLQIFKIEPKIIAQSHNKRIISLLRVLNIPTILFCEAEETRAHYACAVERHLSNQTSD